MSLRYVYGAMTAVVFTCGVVAVEPAHAQRRDGALLPPEHGGEVTVAGCLVHGDAVRGGKKDKYVLAHPKQGPVTSVPNATCSAEPDADALTLDNTKDAGMNDALVGRWIQISGRLEREQSKNPDDLRELDVETFQVIPVAVPRAALPSAPPPAALNDQPPSTIEEPVPVATTGQADLPATLPKTASPMATMGLFGFLSFAAGVALRSFRSRRARSLEP